MSTKWTANQAEAINVRNTNTLVSAAAGSGKTAVLVERVINIITDENNPVYINNLLVATFTNAAAAEMKERIYKAIQQKMSETPDNDFLNQQLVLLGQAQITTVHSFCINLLRENFYHLGIRHDFEIGDEVKLDELKDKALTSLFDEMYKEKNKDFLSLVDVFGGARSDSGLVDMVLNLGRFSEAVAYPEKWLMDCIVMPDDMGVYKNYIFGEAVDMIFQAAEGYKTAIGYIKNDEAIAPYLGLFGEELDFFETLCKKIDERDFVKEALLNFSFKTLPRKNSKALDLYSDIVKSIRDGVKKSFNNVLKLIDYTDEEIEEEYRQMLCFVKPLCELTAEFRKRYAELKLEENLMDFADLEHFSIKLLDEHEDVRQACQQKYAEIFVDEYQDTNAVQARLFELLSRGNNLFMVGDVKQSIYAFRNSNPRFFIDKYNEFDIDGNKKGKKILLSDNFRSTNGVISFVNDIFGKIMTKNLGGVDYGEDHVLAYGNKSMEDVDVSAEVHIIDQDMSECSDDEQVVDKTQLEAIFVANSIINLVENEKPQIYDKYTDKYRNIEYRDIAILMRKVKGVANVYADVFAKKGIPVFSEETGTFFNSIEIATVLSFLKIIENPLQDIPMLAVMRSHIYGFDDNAIAELRAGNLYEHIYTTLKNSDNPKALKLVADLEKLSELSKSNDVDYIIRKIIYDTGYYQFVGGLPGGEMRMANLRVLCEKANNFARGGYKNLLRFVRYIESVLDGKSEFVSAKMLSENDNVVNIMTIHKSKGLEFPVVYLSNCGAEFNKRDLSKIYMFDADLGVATDIVDVKRRFKYPPYVKKAYKIKKELELVSEEVRLLYVALTRAKYKVVVTAAMNKAYDNFSKLNSKPSIEATFKGERTYIQWLSNVLKPANVQLHSAADVLDEHKNCCLKKTVFDDDNADFSEFYTEIDKRLNYTYQFENSRFVPSKKSISEIADTVDENVHLASVSVLSSGLTPAQRGTVIHFVLQNLDLNDVSDESAVKNQLGGMVSKDMLSREYADLVDCVAISEFFSSDIGKRMLASGTVYREFKFCVDVPSADLDYEDTDEKILVQGVIDCCFIEDGEFVIVDYKTGSMQEKYKRQLEMYAKCLEIATGKMVKETCIYPLI